MYFNDIHPTFSHLDYHTHTPFSLSISNTLESHNVFVSYTFHPLFVDGSAVPRCGVVHNTGRSLRQLTATR